MSSEGGPFFRMKAAYASARASLPHAPPTLLLDVYDVRRPCRAPCFERPRKLPNNVPSPCRAGLRKRLRERALTVGRNTTKTDQVALMALLRRPKPVFVPCEHDGGLHDGPRRSLGTDRGTTPPLLPERRELRLRLGLRVRAARRRFTIAAASPRPCLARAVRNAFPSDCKHLPRWLRTPARVNLGAVVGDRDHQDR
jgi:hypothetical protein